MDISKESATAKCITTLGGHGVCLSIPGVTRRDHDLYPLDVTF